jgi:hypothetical protein
MMQDGKPKSLQTGTNGYTCLIGPDGTPLCADENGMAWVNAIGSKSDPPNKIGFIYILAGDTGTSNHDPSACIDQHCRPASRDDRRPHCSGNAGLSEDGGCFRSKSTLRHVSGHAV